ncbi:MAG TPA: signal peptidase II [Candidatus Limnocylindrales bacterium]|nr:signal peptidase II [Candidatus Limnocylindrales bacterium]
MTGPASPGWAARPRWAVFWGLAVAVLVLDQLTKAALVANLDPGESVEVLGDWLRLVHGQNDGAIFGLFQGSSILFAAVSLLVIGLIVLFQARSHGDLILAVALGLLLGGAIGNLVDRLRYGYVVDFIDMGIGGWRFYTFNVADASISLAVVLLLVRAVWPAPQPTPADG